MATGERLKMPIPDATVQVSKTFNEQDTVYEIAAPVFDTPIEFRQDPVDPSTFRRYINGVRR